MVRRANLFVKMVAILFSLMLVTLLFYGLSYRKDIGVITDQIKTTDLNHLEFLTQQMDNNINQLAGSMYALQRDPTIRDYEQIQQLGHLIDPAQTVMTVLEKLSLQTSSSTWENRIVLYKPRSGETLGSDSSLSFDTSILQKPLQPGWEYIPEGKGSNEAGFRLLLSDPLEDKGNPRQAELLMSMYFPVSNIERMFDTYQSQNKGDTFLYHPAYGIILSRHTDRELARQIIKAMEPLAGHETSDIFNLKEGSFLVSSVPSSAVTWQVIHYSPLKQILQPIQSSRFTFLTGSVILLVMSLLFSLQLYRQVQRPVSLLLRSLNRMKEGRWSTRIHARTNPEFTMLNEEFNEMAEKIQALIEQVYLEQLQAKDAHLKQLQSQINPHFLYNCLFFIKSKAVVGDTASVEAMALNLGEYYRYITRVDHSLTTLEDELKLLENYLEIQNLRKQRICYTMDIAGELLGMQIPRLLIQPLVENSIIHGIEKKIGQGFIRITASQTPSAVTVTVEDNGAGMTGEAIASLQARLSGQTREDGGCGLWNIQQRLKYHYGNSSGLLISSSPDGGLIITLCMEKKEEHHAPNSTG
ncbi:MULTISPECIES: sensor histidine kinase [unclassified Paenibacillus]|uniref:sensor histidine kinase n=1 Tax=unclassified Paenibacillus TaxID=185978 RepID=UPI0024059F93|nr:MULTISPECIES: sensor histidine kinase [unclassified Paenibacillus]MDF9843967.1 two-component system sensor histidine kinase YesM [Paenibacillus sp. PastF-2]MDF9850572.1 two-component system sensor histidine kinase YesM [Paenibacillus sp. PastM-2]MDF9856298.1 two-component system sensor histidine kinase YesM [Paenibacillus sp. PastF-1]MDH6481473.1 two-component system sensor histidine kinase YesM [Paenibacillus sp. PastH-2]MDH6509787.1 two-component system sensor histidine kinase YesM [Paeni